MPICCNVMWSEFCHTGGDSFVSIPPSGKGSSLTLRFVLPRSSRVPVYSHPRSPCPHPPGIVIHIAPESWNPYSHGPEYAGYLGELTGPRRSAAVESLF